MPGYNDFDPSEEYQLWNGDIRPLPGKISRNGDSDWEDQGFMCRGVRSKTTYGKDKEPAAKKPRTVRVPDELNGGHVDVPLDRYSVYGRPKGDPAPPPQVKKANKRR